MAEQDAVKAVDVKKFLEKDAEPISTSEFNEWWKSLSIEEKEAFKEQLPPKE